ncbi:hypothetical protein [Calidifontibacter terrae]
MPSAADLISAIARGQLSFAGRSRLEFIASIDDRVWELVAGGPQGQREYRRGDYASLNPQPLPPHEIGRLLMDLMARGIIIVSGRDGAAMNAFQEDLEDWCGTPWPRHWPWPGPGPFPPPEFDPSGDFHRSALIGGALAAAELAARYPAGDMHDVFEKGAQRLTEAALTLSA